MLKPQVDRPPGGIILPMRGKRGCQSGREPRRTGPVLLALGGAGAWPPAGPDPSAALWQGQWPLPEGARRSQADQFPALRSVRPRCGHVIRTLLCKASVPGQTALWAEGGLAQGTPVPCVGKALRLASLFPAKSLNREEGLTILSA